MRDDADPLRLKLERMIHELLSKLNDDDLIDVFFDIRRRYQRSLN